MTSVRQCTPACTAWLLPAGTLFFSCGIYIGRSALSWHWALAMLGLALGAAVISRGRRRMTAALAAALALGILAGWHAWHPATPAPGNYAVRGTVTQQPRLREDGRVQSILADVTLDGKPAGSAYWTFYLPEGEAPPAWLKPGVQLQGEGKVYLPSGQTNPYGYDFRESLLQKGIAVGLYTEDALTVSPQGFSLWGKLAEWRYQLSLRLRETMGEEAGALASEMLLGLRDALPEADRSAFRELGMAHVLCISGYHVGVLAGILLLLLRPLPIPRGWRVCLEAAVLLSYCAFTGGNAPVLRAAGMLLWREIARLRQRQVLPLHILCITALMQLAGNPTILTSASFQLSYSAMLGLTLVYPWLKHRCSFCRPWLQKIWLSFCAVLSAQLGILLPQLYWFGELPLAAVLMNMLVMLLISGLMVLYWLTLAALPVPGLATLLGTVSAGATRLLLTAIRYLASLELATLWTRQADVLTLVGWALLLCGLSFLLPQRLERFRRPLQVSGLLLILLILLPLPRQDAFYIQFDTGDADAAVLQDGRMTVVIDTGENGNEVAGWLQARREKAEVLVLTHLHADHAGGLRAMLDAGIPVGICYLPDRAQVPVIDEEVLPLLEELAATGTELRVLHRGDVLELEGIRLTAVWPEVGRSSAGHDANDVCLVLYAEVGGVTMLLTGDLSGRYERYAAMPADVLKIAHHGSTSATSPAFLAAVSPQTLLLSNRDEEREHRMAELAGEIPLYSTARCGAVTLTFPGDGTFTVEGFLPFTE